MNLFWPNLVPWSGMLWDPKRFPTIFYEANRDDTPAGIKFAEENEEFKRVMYSAFGGSLRARFFFKFIPKSFSKVKDMKKIVKGLPLVYEKERSGIVEYIEDASKTDEHYFRVYENFNCWGFENVGAAMVVEKLNELLEGEFGKEVVNNKATAVYIKNQTVFIVVLSSVLAQEIKFRERQMVEKLNDYYNQEVVKGVFCMG